MMLTTQHYNVDIPKLGFGTWKLGGDDARRCVAEAIEAGYRHIDTAQAYGNERDVGLGLADSGIAREDIWVTTKIWRDAFRDGPLQDSLRQSLDELKLDHVDLVLLHWPNEDVLIDETIHALNDVRDQRLALHIGVSNFTCDLLEEAIQLSTAPILTNQVEYHPFIDQAPVIDLCRQYKTAVTAYSPLAQGNVFSEPVLQDIGAHHGKSPAQVALRWLLQQDSVIAIPRSSSIEHLRANADIYDFELSDEDMAKIGALTARNERLINPSWAPQWDEAA